MTGIKLNTIKINEKCPRAPSRKKLKGKSNVLKKILEVCLNILCTITYCAFYMIMQLSVGKSKCCLPQYFYTCISYFLRLFVDIK